MAIKNHVDDEPDVVKIPLTRGKSVIIDADDTKKVLQYKWVTLKAGTRFYAATLDEHRVYLLMHRLLTNVSPDVQVIHLNDDGLDNRRINLRLASRSQKGANHNRSRNNTSGYKGVYWHQRAGKWAAHIKHNYKAIHLGLFVSKEEAATAYDTAALHYFSRFAKTNSTMMNPASPTKPDKQPIITPELAAYSRCRHLHKTNTSGYRGVCRKKSRWLARISVNGRRKHIGYFASAQDAARACEGALNQRA